MHVRAAGAGDYNPCRCTPKFEALVRSDLWRGGRHGSTRCRKRFSVKRTFEWYPIHPMPLTLFRPRESSRKDTWTTTHDPAMTESDYCLHGWNTDHDYLIPEWITIPEVAAVLKITCQRWMEKNMFSCLQLPQPCPNNYVLLCAGVNVLCPRWVMFRS